MPHVVTVFAGNPPQYPDPMRLWDVQSGFEPGDDVMETRRNEDRNALALLDATPHHLDFIEHTYLPNDTPVAPDVVAPALSQAIGALEPTLVLAPFGLANPDHDVTHRACMRVRDELDDAHLVVVLRGQRLQAHPRHAGVARGALVPARRCGRRRCARPSTTATNARWPPPTCYPTQLYALEDDWQIRAKLAAPAPEQYWRIEAPPEGWERIATDQS